MSEEDLELIEEMMNNCVNSGVYRDIKAMKKYKALKNLQQENQQLKDELNKYKRIYRENPTLYDEIAPYIINECNLENELKQYKSTLDEIRKYIETHVKEHIHDDYDVTLYNSLNQDECDELLQILDKVKE